VICPELAGALHFEVKRVQSLNLKETVAQATRDAEGKAPVVAHRRNGEQWMVTMPAWVLFPLLRGGVAELREMIASTPNGPREMGCVGADGTP